MTSKADRVQRNPRSTRRSMARSIDSEGFYRTRGELVASRNRRLRGEVPVQPVLNALLRRLFVLLVAIVPVKDLKGVVHDKRDGH